MECVDMMGVYRGYCIPGSVMYHKAFTSPSTITTSTFTTQSSQQSSTSTTPKFNVKVNCWSPDVKYIVEGTPGMSFGAAVDVESNDSSFTKYNIPISFAWKIVGVYSGKVYDEVSYDRDFVVGPSLARPTSYPSCSGTYLVGSVMQYLEPLGAIGQSGSPFTMPKEPVKAILTVIISLNGTQQKFTFTRTWYNIPPPRKMNISLIETNGPKGTLTSQPFYLWSGGFADFKLVVNIPDMVPSNTFPNQFTLTVTVNRSDGTPVYWYKETSAGLTTEPYPYWVFVNAGQNTIGIGPYEWRIGGYTGAPPVPNEGTIVVTAEFCIPAEHYQGCIYSFKVSKSFEYIHSSAVPIVIANPETGEEYMPSPTTTATTTVTTKTTTAVPSETVESVPSVHEPTPALSATVTTTATTVTTASTAKPTVTKPTLSVDRVLELSLLVLIGVIGVIEVVK